MSTTLRLMVAVALVTTGARAAPDDGPPLDRTLSLPVVGLLVSSLGVQLDQRVSRSLSVATSMAVRRSGGEDFDVWETGFGIEGRYWMRRDARVLSGPYAGARVEYGTTRVLWHGRPIGTTLRFGESVSMGWRFLIATRFELTPSLGFGARTELDGRGRLAAWTRPEIMRLGLTAGVCF